MEGLVMEAVSPVAAEHDPVGVSFEGDGQTGLELVAAERRAARADDFLTGLKGAAPRNAEAPKDLLWCEVHGFSIAQMRVVTGIINEGLRYRRWD